MSNSVFVVMERDFEYTDEYYYSTEGGNPVKAFADREEAEAEAERMNNSFIETCDSHSLAEYFQGSDDGDWGECCAAAQGDIKKRLAYAHEHGFYVFHVVEVRMEPPAQPEAPNDFEFSE